MGVAALCSGGLDSAVAAALRKADLLIFVDYGQQASRQECDAVFRLAKHFGAAVEAVECQLPCDEMNLPPGPGPRVVPGRNLALLGIGVAWASHHARSTLVWGAAAGDHDNYPDCRSEFVSSVGEGAAAYRVRVEAPVLPWPRQRIREWAIAAGLPETFSCYAPVGFKHCGECDSCRQDER